MNYGLGSGLVFSLLAVFIYVLALYVFALVKKNYSIIDHGWSAGIFLAAVAPLILREEVHLRHIIVTVMVATWAMRLGTHLFLRGWGKGESSRYALWRKQWGEHGWFFAFFNIFMIQGGLMWVVALPAIVINSANRSLIWFDALGIVVWLSGFVWESLADHQLEVFKQKESNKGHILKTGLWKYSRHPNYLGEILQWWGIWLLALSVSGGWMTILSPLLVTFLIIKVSGIPLVEEHLRTNPEFREYARRTPMFLSWPFGKK